MAQTPLNVGIFGGSFNPIHIGHLALANYICEYTSLDEVWMMVSPQNPFKANQALLPDALRLELVKLAIGNYPRMKACDFEFHLPRPSYMAHTLEALQIIYPQHRFTLVIGADNWLAFPQWYQSDAIIKRHAILIYPRLGYTLDSHSLPSNVQLIDAPLMDVSSTKIRQGWKDGKDLRFLLPASVATYLQETGLIRSFPKDSTDIE